MTKRILLIGALAAVVAIGITLVAAVVIFPRVAFASGDEQGGRGWLHGWLGEDISNHESRLAEALGISVADLQAAQEEARTAAVQQAVEQGFITQAQADRMILGNGFGLGRFGRGLGMGAFHFGGLPGSAINHNALLAEALGITEAELEAANQEAQMAGVEEALAAGLIAEAQAEQMRAHIQLKSYLDQETMLAEALGMSVEDLRAALSEGKNITTLLNERNTDAVTVRKALLAVYQERIQQAVTDGVITQAQADQILSQGFNFFGQDEMAGGRFGGRGGFGNGGFNRWGGPGGFGVPGIPGGPGLPGMPGGPGGRWGFQGLPGEGPGFFQDRAPMGPLDAAGEPMSPSDVAGE
jgi:hypothetical protein